MASSTPTIDSPTTYVAQFRSFSERTNVVPPGARGRGGAARGRRGAARGPPAAARRRPARRVAARRARRGRGRPGLELPAPGAHGGLGRRGHRRGRLADVVALRAGPADRLP